LVDADWSAEATDELPESIAASRTCQRDRSAAWNAGGNRHRRRDWRSGGRRITLEPSFVAPEPIVPAAAVMPTSPPTPPSAGSRLRGSGASPLSPTAYAAVTVALAAYLIGLTLSIAGNSGSGSSALVRTIKGRLFSPWLVPPWLDLGFDNRLTYGQPEDADHVIEVRPTGDAAAKPLLLPGAAQGERAARWRRLARSIVAGVDDPDRDGLLATAVGEGLFDDIGAEDVTVRVLRRPLPDRTATAARPPQERAYEARVRSVGGEVQLIQSTGRGELAPLVAPEAQAR
jgi:hypothetical protein